MNKKVFAPYICLLKKRACPIVYICRKSSCPVPYLHRPRITQKNFAWPPSCLICLAPKSVKLPQKKVKAQNPLTHKGLVDALCEELEYECRPVTNDEEQRMVLIKLGIGEQHLLKSLAYEQSLPVNSVMLQS